MFAAEEIISHFPVSQIHLQRDNLLLSIEQVEETSLASSSGVAGGKVPR